MDVSIIIVNYNTKELLKNCINSIKEKTVDISYEIIISDNGSKDGSIEMIKTEFPDVILLENNENLGFGRANNRGLSIAKGKYIFYLNSDTLLINNAIKDFFDYFETHLNDSIGALGCNLCDKNFITNFSYGDFGNTVGHIKELIKLFLANTKYSLQYFFTRKPFPLITTEDTAHNPFYGNVDYICGADLFMLNNEYARFDEHYFLYFEEVDLQYNLYKNGLSRLLIKGPEIIHLQGASAKQEKNHVLSMTDFSRLQSNLSLIYYYKKNLSNNFGISIIKFLTIITWLNPYIYKKTKPYIKEIKKI